MNIKEAYKEGFAEQLAGLGFAPSEIDKRIVEKRAEGEGVGIGKGLIGAATSAARGGTNLLKDILLKGVLPAAIIGPAIAGWGLGASKRTGPADLTALTDTALIKDYEDAIKQMKAKERTRTRIKMAPNLKAAAQALMHGPVTRNIENAKKKTMTLPAPPQAATSAQPNVATTDGSPPAPLASVDSKAPAGPGGSMPTQLRT